tara:strand:+ start:134 stop:409 length:276 start_codon:yes stop_codon:yes gene_type:complete
MWQDYVNTAAIVGFNYALIPQIYGGFKNKVGSIKIQTAAITTVGMAALTVTNHTLDLTYSSVMCGIGSTLWGTLLFQSLKYKENSLEDKIS